MGLGNLSISSAARDRSRDQLDGADPILRGPRINTPAPVRTQSYENKPGTKFWKSISEGLVRKSNKPRVPHKHSGLDSISVRKTGSKR